jgi:hypothetical protein
MKSVLGLLGTVLLLSGIGCETARQTTRWQYRWVYVMQNLQVEENAGKLEALMRRAKAAGYNGIVLADYKLSILDRVPEHYFKNVARVQATAKSLGLKLYPTVFGIGYSSGLLSHDVNLVEGLPVRDALFEVKSKEAFLAPDEQPAAKNLDFEESSGDRMNGWDYQDDTGKSTFADRNVKHSGSQSLKMTNIAQVNPQYGNCRVHQLVQVRPYQPYHISVWIKSENFDRAGDVRIAVLTKEGQSLNYVSLGVKPNQDWTQHHVVFNSLQHSEIRLYFGVWGGRNGTLWWDDAQMEHAGLLNVIRREGCPLEVKSLDGTRYEEGKDYERVVDERMGMIPWPGEYEVYHKPPRLHLTPNSRIHDGQRLKVSFHHAITVHEGQATICLSDPKAYVLLKQELDHVRKLLQPPGYFMSHDEIRVANWCNLCQSRRMTPGEMLADNIRRCIHIIRDADPKAELFVWSDMFDSHHNARGDYYLVNGSWAESWKGLSKEVVIVNWNYGERKKSLPFFEELGNRQILAGYYDGNVDDIKTWIQDAHTLPGVVGIMYTTWQGDYSNLEAFAKAAGF